MLVVTIARTVIVTAAVVAVMVVMKTLFLHHAPSATPYSNTRLLFALAGRSVDGVYGVVVAWSIAGDKSVGPLEGGGYICGHVQPFGCFSVELLPLRPLNSSRGQAWSFR